MTPRQRRYTGALTVATFLAMGAALTAGWVALAFGVGSVVVLAVAGRRSASGFGAPPCIFSGGSNELDAP